MGDTAIVCGEPCARRFWYLVANDDGLHIRCTGCQQRIPVEIKKRGDFGMLTEVALDYGLAASRQGPLPDEGLPPFSTRLGGY